MDKFSRIRELLTERVNDEIKILDIGCRRQELKPYVHDFGTYHGADLFQNGSVEYVGDFTKGMPIEDQSYDVTVAADVIEHTAEMTVALEEMMRVTKRFGIVVLPNHAHWSNRMKFLMSARISDKFDIVYPLPLDRHRWLTTYAQCGPFMNDFARERGFKCEQVPSKLGSIGPLIEASVGKFQPNLLNRNMIYILSR